MTRRNLKMIMIRKNFTLSDIAIALDVAVTSVYDTIAGRMKSKRIETALEAMFELPVDKIREAWSTNSDDSSNREDIINYLKKNYGFRG